MRLLIRALARLVDPFLPRQLTALERRKLHRWREPIRHREAKP